MAQRDALLIADGSRPSSLIMAEVMLSMDTSGYPSTLIFPSNNHFKEIMPFDSSDSNILLGRIISREIRPVPVCCTASSFGTADPVRMN
jgi:hypothetical protein